MNPVNFSLEIEQRVLENIMHLESPQNERVQKAFLQLTPDCFYNPHIRELFCIIKSCFEKRESLNMVDILVVIGNENNALHDALGMILDNYRAYHLNDNSLESDVDKLLVMRNLRKQVLMAEKMITEVTNSTSPYDAQKIMLETIGKISSLSHRDFNLAKLGISNEEITECYYDGKLEEEIKIPTTCKLLNHGLNGGIMPKSLVIVAAGASVGKTSFAIYLLDAIARAQHGKQSLFFSIEMEAKHIWMRHVGICAGKQFDKLNHDEKLSAVAKSLAVPIKIYDTAMASSVADIDFILTTARLKAMEKPLSVVVVDYLGLVESKKSFERNDLKHSEVTSKLAQLAIELNCTVIALSQVNRGLAARSSDDRCPWPHDAADSSGGHRSASLWLGVDRPGLYLDEDAYKNQFVVKCRKNRFGENFGFILDFNGGTFAETQQNWVKTSKPQAKMADKTIFRGQGRDFYEN